MERDRRAFWDQAEDPAFVRRQVVRVVSLVLVLAVLRALADVWLHGDPLGAALLVWVGACGAPFALIVVIGGRIQIRRAERKAQREDG